MTTVAAGRAARTPTCRFATVRELTLIEGLRLVRHPIVLAGAALSIVLVLFRGENHFGVEYWLLAGPAAVPFGVGTLLAANLAALRSERSDTAELYGSLASPARVRTLTHLASLAWPAAVCAVLVLVGATAFGAWDGLRVTREGRTAVPSVFELAQGPVVVALLGVLGIALAQWLRYVPVAPVVGVGVLVLEVPFAMWNAQQSFVWFAPAVNPARTIAAPSGSTWPCWNDEVDGEPWPCLLEGFATQEVGWHLLFLSGLAVALGALALLRDERRPRYLVALTVGLGVVASAGVLQLP